MALRKVVVGSSEIVGTFVDGPVVAPLSSHCRDVVASSSFVDTGTQLLAPSLGGDGDWPLGEGKILVAGSAFPFLTYLDPLYLDQAYPAVAAECIAVEAHSYAGENSMRSEEMYWERCNPSGSWISAGHGVR